MRQRRLRAVVAAALALCLLVLWQTGHVGRCGTAGVPSRQTAALLERQRSLHAAAKATQDEFCAALAAGELAKTPPFATQVRIDGNSTTGRDMLVYTSSDIVSTDILNQGTWDPTEGQCYIEAMRSAALGRNLTAAEASFLDVGANIGWFTLLMAAHGYSVIAFEPLERNLEMLRRSICLNPGFADRITLFSHPLSAEDRSGCTMYSSDGNVGNGNTICDPDPVIPAGATVRSRNASTITLDAHVAERRNILLWKMDTEGHEGQVVRGGLNTLHSADIPYITMELGAGGGRHWAHENMTEMQLMETFYDTNYVIHGRACFHREFPLARVELPRFAADNADTYNVYFTKLDSMIGM